MAVKANEVLSYQGNPNDAGGGGPLVLDTPQLSQASRDLAIFSVQRNKELYDQRIKDRDNVYKMIDDEELVPKDILDTDRARIDEKLGEIQNTFLKYKGDIMNNPDRYREYLKKIQEAKSDIKQAQKRYLGVAADMAMRAKAGNPIDAAAYDKHINEFLKTKDFYAPYQPYTPITGFQMDVVHPEAVYETPNDITKTDGFWNITESTINKDKIFDTVYRNWANKDYNHMFHNADGTGYIDMLVASPNRDELLKQWNQGIDNYNKTVGATSPNDSRYVAPINPARDQPQDIAAKIVIAENPAKKVKKDWDSGRAGYDIQNRNVGVSWFNAWTERMNAKTNKEYKDWTMAGGGTTTDKSKRNDAWTFAQGMIKDIASNGQFTRGDKEGTGFSVLNATQVKQLTPDQRKYLGVTTTTDGKITLKDGKEIKDGNSLIVREDGKIYSIDDDDIKRFGNKINWSNKDITTVADMQQIATNRLKDIAVATSGDEFGASSDIDTEGATGPFYNKNSKTKGAANSSGTKLSTAESDWQALPDNTWKYKDGSIYSADGKKIK